MSRTPARRLGTVGRPKGSSSRMARIGGMEIAYEDGLDEHLKNRVQPTPTYPVRQSPFS
jgi:hypothetical protein